MRSKTSNIVSKVISFVAGVLATSSLKVTHALAQESDPSTWMLYASPEVFACGDDKSCLFFNKVERFFSNAFHSWVFTLLVVVALLVAIILGGSKLISKITHNKEQKKDDYRQETAKK